MTNNSIVFNMDYCAPLAVRLVLKEYIISIVKDIYSFLGVEDFFQEDDIIDINDIISLKKPIKVNCRYVPIKFFNNQTYGKKLIIEFDENGTYTFTFSISLNKTINNALKRLGMPYITQFPKFNEKYDKMSLLKYNEYFELFEISTYNKVDETILSSTRTKEMLCPIAEEFDNIKLYFAQEDNEIVKELIPEVAIFGAYDFQKTELNKRIELVDMYLT